MKIHKLIKHIGMGFQYERLCDEEYSDTKFLSNDWNEVTCKNCLKYRGRVK